MLTLREKSKALEAKLAELIHFGEENDAIGEKVHRLALVLIGAADLQAALRVLYSSLTDDFAVPHVAVRLWDVAGEGVEFTPVSDATRQTRGGSHPSVLRQQHGNRGGRLVRRKRRACAFAVPDSLAQGRCRLWHAGAGKRGGAAFLSRHGDHLPQPHRRSGRCGTTAHAGLIVAAGPALAGDEARAAAAAYLDELRYQRRLSALTVGAYSRDLDALLSLSDARALEALGAHDIRRFIAQLHGRGLSGRSIARALSAWRGFYRWLARHRGVTVDPVGTVRAPKSKKALPAALSPDEASRLLDGAAEDILDLRDKAMFELLYSSGLRLAELAGLDLNGGLDLTQGEVQVTGKRRKTRLVPVGDKARCATGGMDSSARTTGKGRRGCAVRQPARHASVDAHDSAAAGALVHQTRRFGQGSSACAAPLLRLPCAAIQRRPARCSGDARACQHRHHPGVHASGLSTSGEGSTMRPTPGRRKNERGALCRRMFRHPTGMR